MPPTFSRYQDHRPHYGRAIRYEKPKLRFFAQEEKAAYLFRLKRDDEAIDIYNDLLEKNYLTLSEQERVRANLRLVEKNR